MSYVFGSNLGDSERFITGLYFQEQMEFDIPYKAARSYVNRAGEDRQLLLGVTEGGEEIALRSSATDPVHQAHNFASSEGRLAIGAEAGIPLDVHLKRKSLGARVLSSITGKTTEEQAKAVVKPNIKTFRYLAKTFRHITQ